MVGRRAGEATDLVRQCGATAMVWQLVIYDVRCVTVPYLHYLLSHQVCGNHCERHAVARAGGGANKVQPANLKKEMVCGHKGN